FPRSRVPTGEAVGGSLRGGLPALLLGLLAFLDQLPDALTALVADLLVELVAAFSGDLLTALLATALAGLRYGHLSVFGILRIRHGESFLRQKRKKGTAGRHPLS